MLISASLLSFAFITGLTGSVHCLGMCGPLVTGYSSAPTTCPSRHLHIGYGLGRITAYTLIGALFGGFGKLVNVVAHFSELQPLAALIGGLLMIVYGLSTLFSFKLLPSTISWQKIPFLKTVIKQNFTTPNAKSTFLLGVTSAFLPCHLLYSMALTAGTTGSFLEGGAVMFAFSLGTTPTVAGVGILSKWIQKYLKNYFSLITSLLMIIAGIFIILYRGNISMDFIIQCLPWKN
ncbi:MAG: sulfite exporter TauE/SafE [bacterium]